MTPQEFLDSSARRLSGAGYTVERALLPGAPGLVARRKVMRVRWFFAQLKISVVVTTVERATLDGFRAFVDDAWRIANAFPGGMPTGLSNVVSIPVLVANTVDPDAAALAATKPPVQWYVGLRLPAIVDLSSGQAHQFIGFIYYGWIFLKFLRKQRNLVTSVTT